MPTTVPGGRLDWLLDDLVHRLAGVRYAVVLSSDGLMLGHSRGISVEDGEQFCAVASALYGVARSAGGRFGGGNVHQAVIELDHAVLFVTAAGENACVALQTSGTANIGTVAYEVNQTVHRLGAHLSTPPRQNGRRQVETQR